MEAKYQKLAAEYAKLRAQASVLKTAYLEEQSKCANLRDQVRQRDTAIRRAEQEVDSLGFRNTQLEHRVAVLQEEISATERRKGDKSKKPDNKQTHTADGAFANSVGDSDLAQDAIIFEELQKKIMENAQLTSLVDDKERDLRLHSERIGSLEQLLEKRSNEHCDVEKKLRRELETLQQRNSELETKLVEAASMIGSEDALSVSGSDTNTPLHNCHQQFAHGLGANNSGYLSHDDRVALEKEVLYWRTQCEVSKLKESCPEGENETNCGTSSAAAGLSVKPSFAESKSAQRESLKEPPPPPTKEQIIFNRFSQKFEELLQAKCLAESHVRSYETEAANLQNCLENATQELKAKDEHLQSINQALQMLEEDLTTTRLNYEEQISVLTEQVINLSDQLAASK